MSYVSSINKTRTELADLRAYKFDRRHIFVRAHYLVKTEYKTLSEALKQCYAETRNYALKVAARIQELTNNLADRYAVKEKAGDWNTSFEFEINRNKNFSPHTTF